MKLSPGAAAAAAVNHMLSQASWAKGRLAGHAGKTACFRVAPLAIVLTVQGDGVVAAAAGSSAVDATFVLSAWLAARIAAGDGSAWDDVAAAGDGEFARDVGFLAKNLRWDVEEDLSRVIGDIASHRVVGFAASLNRWRKQVTANVSSSVAEYWTEERPLIATSARIAQFVRDVDSLRDDVARFEKRTERTLRGEFSDRAAQPR